MADRQEGETPGAGVHTPGPGGSGAKHGTLAAVVALAIVAAVVIAGIIPRLRAKDALAAETRKEAIPTVNVMHPKMGAPQNEVVLPGNMQAFNDSPIYARTNGYLKKWYVDIGAHVKAGQLLADIETPEVDQQLDQARADLNTAQANMQLSQITAERYQGLAQSDSVSKQDVDNATSDFAAKKAMVASAQSNVKRLEELQSFEKIYAPFDGVITARNTDIGHLINSGAGTPATELFHIAAVQTLRVYVNVPQQYSPSAKPGLTADLTLEEFPGRRFQGTLVRTADAIDLASRTLLVEVDVKNPTGELLPGAYVQVHLNVPSGARSFILPVSALIFRSEGLQVGIVPNGGNKAQLVNITLGRDLGNEVEVVSGLNADDLVIVNPPDSLISGELVQIDQANGSQGPAETNAQGNP
ncbi:MAG TPA: efflux RND transporter periplasmic adaptor subunit [Candidatus Acidoferrales bacterium]|jgi:RND family efflux transporter MFP subunit|nr:efflux RND transporter periplasmic adaptor subunit [Candidatus Acidoferrales bacterium]